VRRRKWLPPIEDDGTVLFHGFLTRPAFVEENARQLMEGFDELPKRLRDKINYAETCEGGSGPVNQCLAYQPPRRRKRR
jgi:hypothetical protein